MESFLDTGACDRRRICVFDPGGDRSAPAADLSPAGAIPFLYGRLFTATSGVCITGLSSIQCNAVLSGFGQAVLLLLIQVGGMGITTLGVGIILVTGKKIGIRERTLIKESLNQPSFQGILRLLKVMLMVTFSIEGIGAVLSFPIFLQDYPVGKSSGSACSIPFRRSTMRVRSARR